jgi:hypothetical protein
LQLRVLAATPATGCAFAGERSATVSDAMLGESSPTPEQEQLGAAAAPYSQLVRGDVAITGG